MTAYDRLIDQPKGTVAWITWPTGNSELVFVNGYRSGDADFIRRDGDVLDSYDMRSITGFSIAYLPSEEDGAGSDEDRFLPDPDDDDDYDDYDDSEDY